MLMSDPRAFGCNRPVGRHCGRRRTPGRSGELWFARVDRDGATLRSLGIIGAPED